ncbi:MAG TPA: flagellar hook capping FlgD N-terminal domain-containing protein [Myxococcales bacterium]|nr:flagellar hook capping FlgD N-terminal domain-containing protein [Myxococcales bacterium]
MSTITDATSTATSAGTGASRTALGKDDFLKLLTAQLAHQDPLSPMDSQAFVAQLAQFANVEQLQGANSRLDALLVSSAGTQQMSATSLVGREVTYRSSSLQLQGAPVAIGGALSSAADSVVATIRDSAGRAVRTLSLGARPAGELSATWDGLDDRGQPLPAGAYTVDLVASSAGGTPVDVQARARGLVTGVSFETGAPMLLIGDRRVPLSDVIDLRLAST